MENIENILIRNYLLSVGVSRVCFRPLALSVQAAGPKRTLAARQSIAKHGKARVRLGPAALSIRAGLGAYLVSQGTLSSWQVRLRPAA